MIEITSLTERDRAAWQGLAQGYNDFYESEVSAEDYERTWRRLLAGREIHALGARLDGRLAGIAHFLFHVTIWRAPACYLQDLFVDPSARGQGAARALIEAVATLASKRDASRFYWQTRQDNEAARALYDKVARFRGFIRYDYPLD